MPLAAGAGLNMPYSATPARGIVSDKPQQFGNINKSTVRGVET
jgi:hypothetical protein